MIQLPFDEARGFDELSIATLKVMASSQAVDGYEAIQQALVNQLGAEMVDLVVASDEYQNLYTLNQCVFEAINRLARMGPWAGGLLEINGPTGLNHQRYLAKQALQKKFFPEHKMVECKVGYTKEDA